MYFAFKVTLFLRLIRIFYTCFLSLKDLLMKERQVSRLLSYIIGFALKENVFSIIYFSFI